MLKKILPLFGLIALLSCQADFSIIPPTVFVDNDGQPIVDPDETFEEQQFGIDNSYCYGFSTPSGVDIATITIPGNFPKSVDLSNFLPAVGNQGQQGSCVGWAAGYYLKSFQENRESSQNNLNISHLMSPAFVYNQIKVSGCDGGSQIQTALELINADGIATWEEMPYNQNDCDTQPTESQTDLAKINKIQNFNYLDGDQLFDQTKAYLLEEQPIVIAITIDRKYFGAKDAQGDAVYRNFSSEDGAHAMLIVGYDDDKNAFKAVNSWGTGWGNSGFVWIDYKAFKEVNDTDSDFKILCEAWVSEDSVEPSI